MQNVEEPPQSGKVFMDTVFMSKNKHLSDQWVSITEIYPDGVNQPLLPSTFSREQFAQGNHYECFMLSTLAALIRFPDIIRNCFVTKKPRRDGRYTFRFFRGKEWVKVEIDDRIALEDDDVLYIRSPTHHWWPLLLEKAYAKFYTAYDHLEGCTLQETFHDLTGNPVLNIPMETKLAKAAGVDINDGRYWLSVGESLRRGDFVASVLTKNANLESVGIQSEQQYAVLAIFSLTGSAAMHDLVAHLHNPFEDDEYDYTGPLNRNDKAWTAKLRAKYDIADRNSIFMPLANFVKMTNSMQMCFISLTDNDATYFDDEWKGETAGGNPTSVTWRKNPLYLVKNSDTTDVKIVVVIKQEDQRRFTDPEENTKYVQCGIVITRASFPHPIPTYYVTGNNHKPVYKSLFLNSREVANTVTIPPNSLCYLVPSTINKNTEARFTLALYRIKSQRYDSLSITKLSIPSINWVSPAQHDIVLREKEKDRVDFYVDEETDVHILMHQTKPFVNRTGGDAMTEDYMGMYLYDDTDRKIGGVHAATNFREVSVIHHLPRSGRFAVSVTCPRAKSDVTAYVTVVGSHGAHVRIVDPPEDATMFDDEDEQIDEGDEAALEVNPVDFTAVPGVKHAIEEQPDSDAPFEDKRFMVDNRAITNDPWVHIGDLYPEGKTQPLLPERLGREQFEQGEHFECCCLSTFAALVEQHPDVIRNCFVTRKPRRDGRYTFQFHRYGQWVKVEIDDRIPQVDGKTLYCRSPTHHWWPLLLEKAYAKFYTLYQNLEGCTLQETFHDFTGRPVVNIPMEATLAQAAGYEVGDPQFWLALNDGLRTTALAGLTQVDRAEALGLQDDQSYAILEVLPMRNAADLQLSDILVKLYNPFMEAVYKGPMNKDDTRWPRDLRQICAPEQAGVIFMPADVFCSTFLNVQQLHVEGPLEPCWNFNSEWGEGTNGGNPTLVTWRQNPLYVVRNKSDDPVQLVAMIRQPDQRHVLHNLPNNETSYIHCGLILSRSMSSEQIPTYLVTGNNHRVVHKGLFLNSREVANVITVPAQSLCYLVPSAMYHEMGSFMLSYWYTKHGEEEVATLRRLTVTVARTLPAVAHVSVRPHGFARVDFVVDEPTEAHILLSQLKVGPSSNSYDTRAIDFVGLYLFDADNNILAGDPVATTFREIGMVHILPKAGRYALSITCPVGDTGDVPCRVEVVCTEAAHVRITDVPEGAAALEEFVVDEELSAQYERDAGSVPLAIARHDMGLVGQEVQPTRASVRSVTPIADRPLAQTLSFLENAYAGIPRGDLALLDHADFAAMAEERQTLLHNRAANASRIADLEDAMARLAAELAARMHTRERKFLDRTPEGVPLELLPLDEDAPFCAMEAELRTLNKSPKGKGKEIVALEAKLNDRAHQIARNLLDAERERFLDPMPYGVNYTDLPLDSDPVFHADEIARLRELKASAPNEHKLWELTERLNQRAQELARAKLAAERDYLASEYLGVPTTELGLDENSNFVVLEGQRYALLNDRHKNANDIAALERQLNDMATNIAAAMLAKERPSYLSADHLGRLLSELPLNESGEFIQLERLRRQLLRDPHPDLGRVEEIERNLNSLADDMARALNAAERKNYLKPSFRGIPASELPLDKDEMIIAAEAQRARLRRVPSRNYNAIQGIEQAINKRADELAVAQMQKDRAYLPTSPEGVPIGLLDLGSDPKFTTLEGRYFDLKNMSNADEAALRSLEGELADRARQLANQYKAKTRTAYAGKLRLSPAEVSLDSDLPFVDLERKLYSLQEQDASLNEEQIADIKEALYKRAEELERQQLQKDREWMDQSPLGVPLSQLDLNNDKLLCDAEDELRRQLKAHANSRIIETLRAEVQQRVNELAAEEIKRQLPFVDMNPEGVALCSLTELKTDSLFWNMAESVKRELQNKQPSIKELIDKEETINEHLREMARKRKLQQRAKYLEAAPAGVPLREVPLDANNEFVALESERRRLLEDPARNAKAIAAAEKQLNDLAREIAEDSKWAEREFLFGREVRGVPLRSLLLDGDRLFAESENAYLAERRSVAPDKAVMSSLVDQMRARVDKVAQTALIKDMEFIDRSPEGVPVDNLNLLDDPAFVALDDKRRPLMSRPRDNALAIAEIEEEMNVRAHELAKAVKMQGRDYLPAISSVGIPTADVPFNVDNTFRDLEAARVEVLRSEAGAFHPERVAALERDLVNRVDELAMEMMWEKRGFLEAEPEGISVRTIGVDDDTMFKELEAERLKLLASGSTRNAQRIADLEDMMNDRVHELAVIAKRAARNFLDQRPEGVPLGQLILDADDSFVAMESERNKLVKDGADKNAARIVALERAMNDRAHELARALRDQRRKFLLSAAEGLPLEVLQLDNDPDFAALEQQYHDLFGASKSGSERDDLRRELEEKMRRRVHALACSYLEEDIADFVDANPEDVPLSALALWDDPRFVALLHERAGLIGEGSNADVARVVANKRALNARAHALAKAYARDNYLPDAAPVREAAESERVAASAPPAATAKLRGLLRDLSYGVPLTLIPVLADGKSCELLERYKQITNDPNANTPELQAAADAMRVLLQARVDELALDMLEGEREQYVGNLDTHELPLRTDKEFHALEVRRAILRAQGAAPDSDAIGELNAALNQRAQELAQLMNERRRYLDAEPEGIPLVDIPLDADDEFVSKERRLHELQADTRGARRHKDEIRELQQDLNRRAHALAEVVKEADLESLEPHYAGIPVANLQLHEHDEFRALANQYREAKRERTSPEHDAKVLEDMKRFARDIAEQMARSSAFPYADIPLEDVPRNLLQPRQPGQLLQGAAGDMEGAPRAELSGSTLHRGRLLEDERRTYAAVPLQTSEESVVAGLPYFNDEYLGVPVAELNLLNDPQVCTAVERYLKLQRDENGFTEDEIRAAQAEIHACATNVAALQLQRERAAYLPSRVHGVPLGELPLNNNAELNALERELRQARKNPALADHVADLERRIRDTVDGIADAFNRQHRAFLNQSPRGIDLEQLPLNEDEGFLRMEAQLRRLEAQDPNSPAVHRTRAEMERYVDQLARDMLRAERPQFLGTSVCGIPLSSLHSALDADALFGELERERFYMVHKKDGARRRLTEADKAKLSNLEERLRQRAAELARKVRQDSRAFLQPAAGDIALEQLPLDTDADFAGLEADRRRLLAQQPVSKDRVAEVERRMARRVTELANELRGWRDEPFHAANEHLATNWPRLAQLYPEGLRLPLCPEHPSYTDVASPPGDITYLAPFLAALSRQPPLLQRLFHTVTHPISEPYTFVFFDPSSNPVYVDIDDRVPCDGAMEPRFTRSPRRAWWPLLLEKAYAKFVGGYERLDDCTSHETLRDLTGRPVTHLPLDAKLAKEVHACEYRLVRFWRNVHINLSKGDLYIAVSNDVVPDGIHPRCYYAVFDVIETVPGSNDPADVIVKLHNCYHDAPHYDGPMCAHDPNWTDKLRRLCGVVREDDEDIFLYLPQPVFLRNFGSMQRCHINCGDRLTLSGAWQGESSGGNPKYTTFRHNPIYLVENKGPTNATVMAELRHAAPVFVDPHGVAVYHITALALLQADASVKTQAPLLTYSTHKFLLKGLLTDAREVCAEMEVPAQTTCYLVPYTKQKGSFGEFSLSIYPQGNPVELRALRPIDDTHACLSTDVVLHPSSDESARVDFEVGGPCDVHILLHQNKVTSPPSVPRGDYLAEDEVMMAAYEGNSILVAATGDASNAREQGLTFRAAQASRYTILLGCPSSPVTGNCPCTLSIFTTRGVPCRRVAVPSSGRGKVVAPRLPRQAPGSAPARPGQQQQEQQRQHRSGVVNTGSGSVGDAQSQRRLSNNSLSLTPHSSVNRPTNSRKHPR